MSLLAVSVSEIILSEKRGYLSAWKILFQNIYR